MIQKHKSQPYEHITNIDNWKTEKSSKNEEYIRDFLQKTSDTIIHLLIAQDHFYFFSKKVDIRNYISEELFNMYHHLKILDS